MWRSDPSSSLAQLVQPTEGVPGQRPAEAEQPGTGDGERRASPIAGGRVEPNLDVDAAGRQVPSDERRFLDAADEQHSLGPGAAEQRWVVGVPKQPPRPGHKTPAVGLDRGEARPPIGQVVRLGEKRPDVAAGREQLALSLNPRHSCQATNSQAEEITQTQAEQLDHVPKPR